MAIVFHCEHCGKKIEAADDAGGKRGTCPVCHNKLYVPSRDVGDELKLAPVDETELEREKRLGRRSIRNERQGTEDKHNHVFATNVIWQS